MAKNQLKDLAFGTVLEHEFYIPVDKTDQNNQALQYYFNGDDDLWVFIDGELALDIGGAHGSISGSINFKTGKSTVYNAVQITGYNSGAGNSVTGKTTTTKLSDSICSPGKHTMKIFYLERGAGVSNCYMKFNLPSVPKGSVQVSKRVASTEDGDTSLLKNQKYTFKISAKNNDDNSTLSMANKTFSIIDSSLKTSSATTDSQGRFTLLHGQTAYFEFSENYSVTVEEIQSDIVKNPTGFAFNKTTLNGNNVTKLTQTTQKDQVVSYDFINYYDPVYGDLKIIKQGIEAVDNNSAETQTTLYTVSGTSYTGEKVYIEVAVVGNSFTTIKHLPAGTYTVTEKSEWSWRYEPVEASQTVIIKGNETTEVTFMNKRDEKKWLSGDSYCENIFKKKEEEEET